MHDSPAKRVVINDDMTIYQAEAQKEQLLAALAAADALELDLGGVATMDTAGLQLLILLKREAAQQGKRLTIGGHSAAVRHILDFCNLVAAFGDPLIIPAKV